MRSDSEWRSGNLEILQRGFEAAEAVTRKHAKSFSSCSVALPLPKRRAAFSVYAFCRYVDDVVDEGDPNAVEERAAGLGVLLDRVYARDPSLKPIWQAFSLTVLTYEIPQSYFEILIRGVLMDLEPVHYETWEELEDYCFHVAGVVGLIMTRIFGVLPGSDWDEVLESASHLGTAMQLTNILRDVAEDWEERGRIYLPRAELNRFGVTEDMIAKGEANEVFKSLVGFQIERARAYYRLAEGGIPKLTDDGSRLAVLAMSRIYGAILNEIEALDRDIFESRAYTSASTKMLWLLRAYGDLTRLRVERRLLA